MAKSIIDRYYVLRRIFTFSATLCGANIIDPNYRMNCVTWYLIIAIKVFFVFTGYTTYDSYSKEGDWTVVLQNLCTLATAVQGYCKLLTILAYKQNLRSIFGTLEAIFKEYQYKHMGYQRHLNKYLMSLRKIVKSFALLYSAAVIVVVLCPVYYYIVYNKRLLVLQIQFPGLDPDTTVGYFTLNSIHMSCVFFGSFGNFTGDMYMIFPLGHMPMFKDILITKFQDINEKLLENPVNRRETTEALKDAVHWHQKYLVFLKECKTVCYWVVLVQISSSCFGIAITIVCVLLDRWPGGQVYLLCLYVIMNAYCALGTVVNTTCDDFENACYNEVLWYKLTSAEQKVLRMMLMMTQNTERMTVGSVAPLDMNLALRVTKSIYTFTMMFINFLNE